MFIGDLNSSVLAHSRSVSLRVVFQPLLCRAVTFGSPLSKMPGIVTVLTPTVLGTLFPLTQKETVAWGTPGPWVLTAVFSQCPHLVVLCTCTESIFKEQVEGSHGRWLVKNRPCVPAYHPDVQWPQVRWTSLLVW